MFLAVSLPLLVWCSGTQLSWTDAANTATQVQPELSWDNGQVLKIVTTFLPLYAHTANLIDGNDVLTNLVPSGTSVHTWQPRPSDVLEMEEADIIITNGLWLEEFLDAYLDDLENSWVKIVDSSVWVEIMEFENKEEHEDHDEEEHEDHDEEEHEDHDHEWPDPHIRLDPNNAIIQVWNIREALVELDPSQQDEYTEASTEYISSLNDLDNRLKQEFADNQLMPFIVFHDAYEYFLRAFDLNQYQVGFVLESHGDAPSQREIAELIEVIEVQW